jgi:SAM-dependent methyltransferase
MLKLLHVGCGPQNIKSLPNFDLNVWEEIRLDIDPSVNPDVIGTLTDMSSVTDSSVDAVYSSHNIEHVYPHEVNSVFSEFLRVLKPSGFVIISCPDLASVAQGIISTGLETPLYVSPAGPITPLDILYGHIDSMTRGNLYMAHKTGFTWESLKTKLHGVGFPMVYGGQYTDIFALKAVAYKSMQTEEYVRSNSLKFLS